MVKNPMYRTRRITPRHAEMLKTVEHDSDEETASLTSFFESSSTLSVSNSSESFKTSNVSKDCSQNKLWDSYCKQNALWEEIEEDDVTPLETRWNNAKRSLKQNFSFRIDCDELVEREMKSDLAYTRRSMDLSGSLRHSADLFVVFDWSESLFHEPPSNKEAVNLKSCMKKTGKKNGGTVRKISFPSDFDDLCDVVFVVGYDRSMIQRCFYNAENFQDFRMDKFMEDNPGEYEFVSDHSLEEYEEEIIEEEIHDDESYYEEEIIEEEIVISHCPLPTKKPSMISRITSV